MFKAEIPFSNVMTCEDDDKVGMAGHCCAGVDGGLVSVTSLPFLVNAVQSQDTLSFLHTSLYYFVLFFVHLSILHFIHVQSNILHELSKLLEVILLVQGLGHLRVSSTVLQG